MAEANKDAYVPRLRTHYDEVVRQKLIEQFGYKNPMQVPRIDKIVINMGVGEVDRRFQEGRRRRPATWR